MRGLRVVAEMAEPVVPGVDGLHLDGLLALGAFLSLSREERETLPPIDSRDVVDFDLPLGRWRVDLGADAEVDASLLDEDGMAWGWLATRELGAWELRGALETRKHPEVDHFIRWSRDKSYNRAAGPAKAYDLTYPTGWAPRVEWAAIGDVDKVRDLIGRVRCVGKKASSGHGRVLRWSVEADALVDEAFVLAHRRMPRAGGVIERGVRPPYHHPARRAPC